MSSRSHLVSRRRFLGGALATSASLLAVRKMSAAEPPAEAKRYVLMSDTHVNADPKKLGGREQTNMFDNLLAASKQTVALDPKPAAVIMHGDEGFLYGAPGEYVTVAKAIAPITNAGIPVHMAMGNHDNRSSLWKQFPPKYKEDKRVPGRHISVIETPFANWYVIDTLGIINASGGKMGKKQVDYILKEIDAHKDKPAIVSSHHQPWEAKWSDIAQGILDGERFTKEIVKRRNVKVWFHGHLHLWRVQKMDDLPVIGLPALGWQLQKGQTQAYVIADLAKSGIKLQVQCLKTDHPRHDKMVDLKWRA